MAAGYSLGGNALLKYLHEHPRNPLTFAVSVCPPLNLAEGAKRLNTGFSRIYQRVLVRQLVDGLMRKDRRYPDLLLNMRQFKNIRTLIEFDYKITAPLHGYRSANDYYQRASTLTDLRTINTPTHILFAGNDPFFSHHCIPASDNHLSSNVKFELADRAGHVAFINGSIPFFGHDWLRNHVANLILKHA